MADDKSFLEMSDEDMLNAGPPSIEPAEESTEPLKETTEPVIEQEEPAEEVVEKEEVEEISAEEEEKEEVLTEPVVKAEPKAKVEGEKVETTPVTEKVEPKPAETVDYKAFTDAVMAPFKANGREMQVKDAAEAVQLMQMGANYNKKMGALKPHLAMIKQLENNDLLSDEKIGFLIDLHKKNPEAIAKLVKDSGFDPLEADEKAGKDYKPTSYAVDPRQLALDETLDTIKESPKYAELLDTVANKWDADSKNRIVEAPQVLRILDNHMTSGIYDLITTEVERQKALGKLPGVSDLIAYQQVGDAMNAQGAFAHLGVNGAASVKKVVTPAPKEVDVDLNARRRAAAPAKSTPAKKAPATYNPLALSDEEFAKLGNPSFS